MKDDKSLALLIGYLKDFLGVVVLEYGINPHHSDDANIYFVCNNENSLAILASILDEHIDWRLVVTHDGTYIKVLYWMQMPELESQRENDIKSIITEIQETKSIRPEFFK